MQIIAAGKTDRYDSATGFGAYSRLPPCWQGKADFWPGLSHSADDGACQVIRPACAFSVSQACVVRARCWPCPSVFAVTRSAAPSAR